MQSDNINELAAALAKAQGEMDNATLNKVNPHFRSKYADLASVRDATAGALCKFGIAVTQTIAHSADNGWHLVTKLVHSSGQWVASTFPLPTTTKPQEFMSALTYARRGSLSAICGISADEDDDGNAAEGKPKVAPKAKPAPETEAAPQDDAPDAAEAERLAAIEWSGKAMKTIDKIKVARDLDAFEEKYAGTIERLQDLDRPSWERLKGLIGAKAKALDPAGLLAAG